MVHFAIPCHKFNTKISNINDRLQNDIDPVTNINDRFQYAIDPVWITAKRREFSCESIPHRANRHEDGPSFVCREPVDAGTFYCAVRAPLWYEARAHAAPISMGD